MSGSLKLGVVLILGVIGVALAISVLKSLINLIMPIAIVAGVGLILYGLINRKALGGSGRRYLP
ncbi:MAG: hypothetical protein HND43_07930 [Armatimonadetes bacterium]|uniref:Uncharacterized protein n=1 Tax=Candidatus Nitrosymbiomonas proteolyticus TaxID=2608984 RepID=A0A809RI22_9BACT|nr:MAG: hypothetical protein UZ18_ATM001002428 [Armatimonadetes bacterium OLB18]MBL1152643.1 hypothetical protein [Armatimonadota bacterium]MBV6490036.1 hypothetical protein [Fimbriimonadaceae bacterium]QOJ12262.1 MAG: hypothetical protein HRU74_09455 [Chthonomonadaceae bacterium]BBO24145.1 conserved hypothetical protein [Candidatus Nitrosymbiomonas proteolyticus]